MASGVQEQVDALLGAHQLSGQHTVEMSSYLMLPPLLQAGDYLVILPGQLADAFCQSGHFSVLSCPLRLPVSTIYANWW